MREYQARSRRCWIAKISATSYRMNLVVLPISFPVSSRKVSSCRRLNGGTDSRICLLASVEFSGIEVVGFEIVKMH